MKQKDMRRAEKKLSHEQAIKIINKAPYGVLSLCEGGQPYGVPLSHALCGGTIYFHCAHSGMKLDIISKNPKGHFVFVSKAKILAEKATVDYKSTMAYGTLRIVDTPKERKKAYKAIVDKYMSKYQEAAVKTIEKSDAKTTLVAMDIESLTAKGNSKAKKAKEKGKATLASPITIKGKTIKNRIVMPAMVRFLDERPGYNLTKDDYKYYEKRAKNGTGLVIVEATAVAENGVTFKTGLNIWDDSQIDQFKKLTSDVKKHGAVILLQLVHGGFKSDKKRTQPLSSSDFSNKKVDAKAMTEAQADEAVENFAQAALRAQKAGFDGVELHGCHSYLINQFSCPSVNKRDDKYAPSSAFGVAVIKRVKELCDDDFIISMRTAVDSPTVENSLNTAVDYQNAGADILNVSAGINTEPYKAPGDWKYSDISHLAYLVKQKVSVPVIGVYAIRDAKSAQKLVGGGYVDMVAVGRNHLIHPDWAKRALEDEYISRCRLCKGCYFFGARDDCPAIKSAKKKG